MKHWENKRMNCKLNKIYQMSEKEFQSTKKTHGIYEQGLTKFKYNYYKMQYDVEIAIYATFKTECDIVHTLIHEFTHLMIGTSSTDHNKKFCKMQAQIAQYFLMNIFKERSQSGVVA